MKPVRRTTRSAEEKESESDENMTRENKDLVGSWSFS
jgi:hypothetical protein